MRTHRRQDADRYLFGSEWYRRSRLVDQRHFDVSARLPNYARKFDIESTLQDIYEHGRRRWLT